MIFASRPKQTDDSAKPAPPAPGPSTPSNEQLPEQPRFTDTPASAPPEPPSFMPPAHFASTPSYGRATQPPPLQAQPQPQAPAQPTAGASDPFAGFAPPPATPAAPAEQPGIDFGTAGPQPTVSPQTTLMIVSLLLDEVADVASEAEAAGFLGALGKRVALKHPLGNPANLIEMEAQANRVLGQLGWGRTRMLTGPQGIRVIHQDWPAALPQDDNGHWAEAFPVLLGAVYQHWFAALGAPDDLVTSIAAQSRKAIEYRHGKAEG